MTHFSYTDVVDYVVGDDWIGVEAHDAAYSHLIELYLCGMVLAYYLECRNVPSLHASAVNATDQAVVFLSTSGSGKSVLAASFMSAGCSLLTDDILPLDRRGEIYLGRPSYPTMRLWPDVAEHFLGHYMDLPRVEPRLTKRIVPVGSADGFGLFCADMIPVACIYVPEQRDPADPDDTVQITPLSRAQALIELVRHSFIPQLVSAAGLQPQRLAEFAHVARRVPVRRLVYPRGLDRLPHVVEAVMADLSF